MVSLTTGITLDEECTAEFSALRMKRAHRYLIMKINDDKTKVIIEHIGARDATFEQFKEQMPKDSCRYHLKLILNKPT